MQIVIMDRLVRRLESEVVCRAVDCAALHAAARQDRREAVTVMIAAVLHLHQAAHFHRRGAAELAADDQQRIIEQAARLQVVD